MSLAPFIATNFDARSSCGIWDPTAILGLSACAGLFARIVCYPLDTVHRSMQMLNHSYTGVANCFCGQLFITEGKVRDFASQKDNVRYRYSLENREGILCECVSNMIGRSHWTLRHKFAKASYLRHMQGRRAEHKAHMQPTDAAAPMLADSSQLKCDRSAECRYVAYDWLARRSARKAGDDAFD